MLIQEKEDAQSAPAVQKSLEVVSRTVTLGAVVSVKFAIVPLDIDETPISLIHHVQEDTVRRLPKADRPTIAVVMSEDMAMEKGASTEIIPRALRLGRITRRTSTNLVCQCPGVPPKIHETHEAHENHGVVAVTQIPPPHIPVTQVEAVILAARNVPTATLIHILIRINTTDPPLHHTSQAMNIRPPVRTIAILLRPMHQGTMT
jgi:hypothetical protein